MWYAVDEYTNLLQLYILLWLHNLYFCSVYKNCTLVHPIYPRDLTIYKLKPDNHM